MGRSAYKCCIIGCTSNTSTNSHRFPNPIKHLEMFQKWLAVIGSKQFENVPRVVIYEKYRVCSSHFNHEDYSPGSRLLKRNVVPRLTTSTPVPKKLMDTSDDIRKCIDGEAEENNQFLTDDDIIEEVMAVEKPDDENGVGKGEDVVTVQRITHTAAIDSFTTAITWAKENAVSASDILVLKRLQETVLKTLYETKKQKLIDNFCEPDLSKD